MRDQRKWPSRSGRGGRTVAHCIDAIVGRMSVLERSCREHPGARLVELPQGFALVAATRELTAQAGRAEPVPGF